MTSNKGLGPKKQFWPIRLKLSKPFRRQLTHCSEKLIHELLSNISKIMSDTNLSYKRQTLNELRYKFGSVYVAKTKVLISFAVTAKLICDFVFAYAKSRFSHDAAH